MTWCVYPESTSSRVRNALARPERDMRHYAARVPSTHRAVNAFDRLAVPKQVSVWAGAARAIEDRLGGGRQKGTVDEQ